jgi:hypothetical protein
MIGGLKLKPCSGSISARDKLSKDVWVTDMENLKTFQYC